MKITEDSGWTMNDSTSRPHLGIRHYERLISYDVELTLGEMLSEQNRLQRDNCPGFSGVSGKLVHGNTYRFETNSDPIKY